MPIRFFRKIIAHEAWTGIILMLVALLAMGMSNSPLYVFYHQIVTPWEYWINHGLMSIFFLQVGLEIKAELLEGHLNTVKKALLPGIAALGGMLVPAGIFLLFNHHQPLVWSAWSVPIATDIAFSLAVLQLLGKRVPFTLRLFLLALAIFDDFGAVLVIAVFYTSTIHIAMLMCALAIFALLLVLNYLGVRRLIFYWILGIALWFFVWKSGVDSAIAGVFLAFTVPLRIQNAPAKTLHRLLHPWVAYLVLPLFAFANAGIHFAAMRWEDLFSGLPLGIMMALVIGKPLGVFGFSYASIRLRWVQLPEMMTYSKLLGIGFLCGIGFTMSLLLGELVFKNPDFLVADQIKAGVIIGSVISASLGYLWFRFKVKMVQLS